MARQWRSRGPGSRASSSGHCGRHCAPPQPAPHPSLNRPPNFRHQRPRRQGISISFESSVALFRGLIKNNNLAPLHSGWRPAPGATNSDEKCPICAPYRGRPDCVLRWRVARGQQTNNLECTIFSYHTLFVENCKRQRPRVRLR